MEKIPGSELHASALGAHPIESHITPPSIKEQAPQLKELYNNQNSITIKTPVKQIRYDLDGATHNLVESPHKQVYQKNFVNGQLKSISRATKKAEQLTQQDLRIISNYIKKLQANK